MFDKLQKNIIRIILASVIIYLALTIYADFDKVAEAFIDFNWIFLPLLLILSYSNFVTRFIKWQYYLQLIKVKVETKTSYLIFMSGLVMSITPGKMGELVKSYMIKNISGDSISKTAPIVLVERITDFISLILLAIIGAYVFDYGKIIVIGTGIFFIALVLIISNRKACSKMIKSFAKISFIAKHVDKLNQSYETSYELLKIKPLILMIIVSMFSWFFECFGFYLILINFDLSVTVLWSTFIYAFSTIAGSITMLPAGLGVTEGSLTFLLVNGGVPSNVAVASTFIVRVVTLWFALLIGIINLYFYQKKFGKLIYEKKS